MFKPDFLNRFTDIINSATQILIVVHEYPDLDAVGSALALKFALDNQGLSAQIWVPDNLNPSFDFLPGVSDILRKFPSSKDIDCVIFLDSSHKTRVARHEQLDAILENAQTINLDHHCDNSRFADLNYVTDISSVGELLSMLFKNLSWPISKDMATCLYAAICFDTGRFAYSNTTSQTMHVVSGLLDTGVDPYTIYTHIYENQSIMSFKLLKLALERLVVCREKGYAYTSIPLSAPKAPFKLVDFIRQLKGIDVFMVIQAVNSRKVKVNLRSKQDFDVSAFANQFGGGGHVRASGLKFEDKSLETCIEIMTEALDQALA